MFIRRYEIFNNVIMSNVIQMTEWLLYLILTNDFGLTHPIFCLFIYLNVIDFFIRLKCSFDLHIFQLFDFNLQILIAQS
jgi:hypothetical protein